MFPFFPELCSCHPVGGSSVLGGPAWFPFKTYETKRGTGPQQKDEPSIPVPSASFLLQVESETKTKTAMGYTSILENEISSEAQLAAQSSLLHCQAF